MFFVRIWEFLIVSYSFWFQFLLLYFWHRLVLIYISLLAKFQRIWSCLAILFVFLKVGLTPLSALVTLGIPTKSRAGSLSLHQDVNYIAVFTPPAMGVSNPFFILYYMPPFVRQLSPVRGLCEIRIVGTRPRFIFSTRYVLTDHFRSLIIGTIPYLWLYMSSQRVPLTDTYPGGLQNFVGIIGCISATLIRHLGLA